MTEYPINPSVYNQGAVVFNAAPYANFFLQQKAKKQAKEEALDKYYNDQAKALTPTGMRAKDIEGGWSQKFNEWQKLGMQNRKALINPSSDGYRTLNEFNRLGNELKADIEKSKQFAEQEKQLREYRMSGKWSPTDDDMEVANDVGLSIYDKNRKGLTIDNLSVNRPPLDVNKFLQTAVGSNKRNKQLVGEPVFDAQKGTQTITSQEIYSPQQLKAIAETSGFLSERDGSAKDFFQHALESNDLPALQQAYSSVYGANDLVDTPVKAAKAFAIMQNMNPTGQTQEVKSWTDPNKRMREERELIGLREASRKRVEAAKSAKTIADAKSVMNEQINDLRKFGVPYRYIEGGKEVKAKSLPLTEDMVKSAMLPGESISPNQLLLVKDDKGDETIKRIYFKKIYDPNDPSKVIGYEKDSQGRTRVDTKKTKDIPLKQFRNQWAKNLFSGKILAGELGQELNIEEIDLGDDSPSAELDNITED